MFTWSNIHVMNVFVDNVWNHEADTNSPKQMYQQQFLFNAQYIYPVLVPKVIKYANTSYLIFF